MSYTYYDKYNFPGYSAYSTTDIASGKAVSNPYPENSPTSPTNMTKGLVVGKRAFVVSDTLWLNTTTYYNDKGRPIQENSDNWARGKDIINTIYDFSGKVLSTYQRHTNPKSITMPTATLLTMFHYDAAGRPDSLKKMLNDNPALQRTTCLTTYDGIGQKKSERLINGGKVDKNEFGEYYVSRTKVKKAEDGVMTVTTNISYGEGRNKYSSAAEEFYTIQKRAEQREEWTRAGIWDPNITPDQAGKNALNLGFQTLVQAHFSSRAQLRQMPISLRTCPYPDLKVW